ncbi:MAG: RNA-directed DNA polymerase, partial [Verrucomicrobia bacterium]|nr:RNA-directed DNA polymerase [Verrucomicrobiota bacterium]
MRPIQAQDIVRWGFFRRELPPAFVSHTLANHLVQMQPHGDPKVTHLCSFNVPNGRTARRKLSICHPKSFVELATLLADNLATLETHFAKSSLSASLPSLEVEDYPIFTTLATPPQDLSLSTRDLKRLEAATGMKFAIKTDISKFYPTIYTHSVVWALKGKPWAKAWIRSRRRTEEFATELDSALQNCQDRQTIGIPIGPFTSRIVSEIIGTAID